MITFYTFSDGGPHRWLWNTQNTSDEYIMRYGIGIDKRIVPHSCIKRFGIDINKLMIFEINVKNLKVK